MRDLRVSFGGMKASGIAPESFPGEEALRRAVAHGTPKRGGGGLANSGFFTEPKNVCIAK